MCAISYTVSPGNSFTNLCPGSYTLYVRDSGGPGYCNTMSTSIFVTTTSIFEIYNIDQANLTIYPNPVYDLLKIEIAGIETNDEIEILNHI
jgi:hypothetical protein